MAVRELGNLHARAIRPGPRERTHTIAREEDIDQELRLAALAA